MAPPGPIFRNSMFEGVQRRVEIKTSDYSESFLSAERNISGIVEIDLSFWNNFKKGSLSVINSFELIRDWTKVILVLLPGHTYVADNVADKNISNIPVNVADMLEMLLISLECCWFEQNVADMHRMLLMGQECCWYVLNVPDLPCRQVLSWRFIGPKLNGPKDWNWTAISPRKSQIDGLFMINKSFSYIKPQVNGSQLWKWTFQEHSARSFESEIVKTDRKYLEVKY